MPPLRLWGAGRLAFEVRTVIDIKLSTIDATDARRTSQLPGGDAQLPEAELEIARNRPMAQLSSQPRERGLADRLAMPTRKHRGGRRGTGRVDAEPAGLLDDSRPPAAQRGYAVAPVTRGHGPGRAPPRDPERARVASPRSPPIWWYSANNQVVRLPGVGSPASLVVRHVIIFGHGHGLQRAIIDESQHRTPERLIMAQH